MLKPNKWFGVHLSNNKKMLEMTINVFGNIEDKIKISDNEYIYMFINKK